MGFLITGELVVFGDSWDGFCWFLFLNLTVNSWEFDYWEGWWVRESLQGATFSTLLLGSMLLLIDPPLSLLIEKGQFLQPVTMEICLMESLLGVNWMVTMVFFSFLLRLSVLHKLFCLWFLSVGPLLTNVVVNHSNTFSLVQIDLCLLQLVEDLSSGIELGLFLQKWYRMGSPQNEQIHFHTLLLFIHIRHNIHEF